MKHGLHSAVILLLAYSHVKLYASSDREILDISTTLLYNTALWGETWGLSPMFHVSFKRESNTKGDEYI